MSNPAGERDFGAALPKAGHRVTHQRALPFAEVGAALGCHPRDRRLGRQLNLPLSF